MGIRFSEEVAQLIYFSLCEDYNVSGTMRKLGGSAASFWHWCGESVRQKSEAETEQYGNAIDSKFYLAGFNPERPDEKMWFHEAVGIRAKKIAALESDSRARAALAPKPLRDGKGDVVYEKDPCLLAMYGGETPAAYTTAAEMGEVDYPFLHKINARGLPERIPVMVRFHRKHPFHPYDARDRSASRLESKRREARHDDDEARRRGHIQTARSATAAEADREACRAPVIRRA